MGSFTSSQAKGTKSTSFLTQDFVSLACEDGSFIAACGFWKPNIEEWGMNYLLVVLQRSSASVKTNCLNTFHQRHFWILPFIPSVIIISERSAYTKARLERF